MTSAARRELAESIFDETERLNRLVANLLDMTRLEGGALTMKRDWQPLEEIVGVVLNRLARPLREYKVVTYIPPGLPLLPLDDVLIQQVLMNLLENAMKFSPTSFEGSSFRFRAARRCNRHRRRPRARVSARRGTAHVRQVLPRRSPGRPLGAGLGLAICRGIVELHGGPIWAENRPAGGAAIHFTLPTIGSRRKCPFKEPEPPAAATHCRIMPDRPRILVIEDEPEIRRFLRASLSSHDFDVDEAEKGRDGMLQAATHQPDVVILDLGLPDIDGVEVIGQVRGWSQVPIVVLSARGQEPDKVAALDAGADDYLTKPFGVGELLRRIRVALRHSAIKPPRREDRPTRWAICRVDLGRRQVHVNDREVHLTPTEYRLLTTLIHHAGKVVTHRQLLKEVWGPDSVHETHYLRVFMAQLRQKIEEDSARPRCLLTEPSVGYRLAAGVQCAPFGWLCFAITCESRHQPTRFQCAKIVAVPNIVQNTVPNSYFDLRNS